MSESESNRKHSRIKKNLHMPETQIIRHHHLSLPVETTWIKSNYYCVSCGQREVWQCKDTNATPDYYLGYNAECLLCGCMMHCLDKVE